MRLRSLALRVAVFCLVLIFERAFCATLYVWQDSPNPFPPFADWPTAAHDIQTAVDASSTGDTVLVTNGTYTTGGRVAPAVDATTNRVVVQKSITLQSISGPARTIIEGYQIPGTTNGAEAIRCVVLGSGAVLSGFTLRNGATTPYESGGGAFCSSQNAVITNSLILSNSAGSDGGGALGGTILNSAIAGNVAGDGGGAYGSYLVGCSLSNNTVTLYWLAGGGGAAHSVLNRCSVVGNSAPNSTGGGASQCKLANCIVTGNSAGLGGGASMDTMPDTVILPALINCTVIHNTATYDGGGIYQCAATNSIIYDNAAPINPNYSGDTGNGFASILTACCTMPLPATIGSIEPPGYGRDNIASPPLFIDPAAGDFRLQPNSPCINSGLNDFAATPNDFAGFPRISGGTVDMGAYEFQNPGTIISIAWLQEYGLATNGSADFQDPDQDGMNNWQEWICGTNPTNALSMLLMLTPTLQLTGSVNVTWSSVTNRNYTVERATDLTQNPPFTILATNVAGSAATATFTDSTVIPGAFYRVSTHR